MKIERLITVFDKESDELIEEINIDSINFLELTRIFKPAKEDPLMYMAYEINEENSIVLNTLLSEKIIFNLSKNLYFVECVQLPPYIFNDEREEK